MQTEVRLTAEMQEMIGYALKERLCGSPEEAVLLALREWYSGHVLDSIDPDVVRAKLEEAVADTRPGRPAEEVFAQLLERYGSQKERERPADAA